MLPHRLGHEIPGFLGKRLAATARELESGRVPGAAFSAGEARALLHGACGGPAAFYKDANRRNFLITPAGPVTVDFDDLTLAPFGYDLAKLVVSLSMTYGALGSARITAALGAYNAATRHLPAVMPVTREQLMAWAEIHHILTSRYLGRAATGTAGTRSGRDGSASHAARSCRTTPRLVPPDGPARR